MIQATRTILKLNHSSHPLSRFLDLSTLKLKDNVSSRLPLPLFIRQEYDDISERIKKELQKSK